MSNLAGIECPSITEEDLNTFRAQGVSEDKVLRLKDILLPTKELFDHAVNEFVRACTMFGLVLPPGLCISVINTEHLAEVDEILGRSNIHQMTCASMSFDGDALLINIKDTFQADIYTASVIYHELVHCDQYLRGDLTTDPIMGIQYWKGEAIKNTDFVSIDEELTKPWEFEAYTKQYEWLALNTPTGLREQVNAYVYEERNAVQRAIDAKLTDTQRTIMPTQAEIKAFTDDVKAIAKHFDPAWINEIPRLIDAGIVPLWSCEGHVSKEGEHKAYLSVLADPDKICPHLLHKNLMRRGEQFVHKYRVLQAVTFTVDFKPLYCAYNFGEQYVDGAPLMAMSIEWRPNVVRSNVESRVKAVCDALIETINAGRLTFK